MTRATWKLWEERILGTLDRVPREVYAVIFLLSAGGFIARLVWLLC